jgi:hypothetical protein
MHVVRSVGLAVAFCAGLPGTQPNDAVLAPSLIAAVWAWASPYSPAAAS